MAVQPQGDNRILDASKVTDIHLPTFGWVLVLVALFFVIYHFVIR